MSTANLEEFWSEARAAVPTLSTELPEAWAFGATAEHADSEGEGDRTLEDWRVIHERFWRRHGQGPRGFAEDMPIVCERFRIVFRTEELKS